LTLGPQTLGFDFLWAASACSLISLNLSEAEDVACEMVKEDEVEREILRGFYEDFEESLSHRV